MVTGYGVASGEAKPSPETPLARNTSSKFDLGRNFANKLWNATRFALSMLEAQPSSSPALAAATIDPQTLSLVDRWMLSRLTRQIRAAHDALTTYQFADHATALYDLTWRDFCDWYLEAIKPTVAADPAQRAVLRATLDAIVRALHPTMPFVTEVLFERLRTLPSPSIRGVGLGSNPPNSSNSDLLATAAWPDLADDLLDPHAEAWFDRVRALVTAIREVRAQHNVPPKRAVTLHVPAGRDLAAIGDPAAIALVQTLAGVATLATTPAPTSVAFTFDAAEWRLSNLADALDAASEKARLAKSIQDLDKSIATLDARLSNPGYSDKAPPHMVQQTRDQLTKAKAERDAARAALEHLA
jgi:valyl-tRNA synthetase